MSKMERPGARTGATGALVFTGSSDFNLPGCGGQEGWRECRRGICNCLRSRHAAIEAGASTMPLPYFGPISIADEADSCATFASIAESRAYAAAAAGRLPAADRQKLGSALRGGA